MKKYLLLMVIGAVAVVLCQQIPNLQNQFAQSCATVPILNEDAIESISCKGTIEYDEGEKYLALVQISEDDISRVQVGQNVQLHCNALGDTVLNGKLTELSDQAYQTTYGSMKITVVDAIVEIMDADDRLKSGYSVTADIVLSQLENATILPFEAVAREKSTGKYYIYRVSDGWAKKEYVDVTFEDEKGMVVSTLDPNWVICENPEEYDADRVRVKYDGND